MKIHPQTSTTSTHTTYVTNSSSERKKKIKIQGREKQPSMASPEAEKVFAALLEESGDELLKCSVDMIDTDMLRGCNVNEISTIVEVQLERRKDIEDDNRKSLSKKVGWTLYESLKNEFHNSRPGHAGLILLTRILVASDGSRKGRLAGGEFGIGAAKLTVAYCLFSIHTGKVYMAKQQTLKDTGLFGIRDISKNSGPRLVQGLATKAGRKIYHEIVRSIAKADNRQKPD